MNHFKAVHGDQAQDMAVSSATKTASSGFAAMASRRSRERGITGRIAELGQQRSGAGNIGSGDAANAQFCELTTRLAP